MIETRCYYKPRHLVVLTAIILAVAAAPNVAGQPIEDATEPLLFSACIDCHDAATKTRLNIDALGYDLDDESTFRMWEKIYDRVSRGEMPPDSEPRPDAADVQQALSSLHDNLLETNLRHQREYGRVPARRLTRLEYELTLNDLLHINEDLAKPLPAEADSGGFDNIGGLQGFSPLHIRSYLDAAEIALNAAIKLGSMPENEARYVDYYNSEYVNRWYGISQQNGGNIIKKLDDAVAIFVDTDYIMRSDSSGLYIATPGLYRVTVAASPFQAKTPVTLKIIHANDQRGEAVLLGAFDILPGQTRSVEVEAYLRPGDYLYPSVADLDGPGVYSAPDGDVNKYTGEGIAIRSMLVSGPVINTWPPEGTKLLMHGVKLVERGKNLSASNWLGRMLASLSQDEPPTIDPVFDQQPADHIAAIVNHVGPLAFRHPVTQEEAAAFAALARPALDEGRPFTDALRVPLRSMLSSPQFLLFGGEPGELDGYALASRLSYFLWRSMPDDELFGLAESGRLTEPNVLAEQVERMLDDPKSQRFIRDFLGQSFRLYDIGATTPDKHLYPEFDDILNKSIIAEVQLFFTELIDKNLSVVNLIDSDFTYLNRRLAEHYGMGGTVTEQDMRRVQLPADSPRGGILTMGAILKLTANGTVTSPVVRGNYVLTNLLGTPAPPPPPNVGSIEPDTRGTTTIRETLDAHRNTAVCASCHKMIDPPGFALESFDPIGGFRSHYRKSTATDSGFGIYSPYGQGPAVDATGSTPDGQPFNGINEYKAILIQQQEQVARHLLSQLVVFATGGEIQFADRDQIEAILRRTATDGYPVRTLIQEVVASRMFRNK